jgi:hypothetical protein
MNSVQAIEDRPEKTVPGRITVEIERLPELNVGGDPPIAGFRIKDNGVGFNDVNFDSFNTAFSEHKLPKGGKGLGRFVWLKAFERADVESVFTEPDAPTPLIRRFRFDESYDPDKATVTKAVPGTPLMTTVHLVGLREPYRGMIPRAGDQIGARLLEHFLLIFLQPGCPAVDLLDGSVRTGLNETFARDFRATASDDQFTIGNAPFTVSAFRLSTARFQRHRLIYAANHRGVLTENLDDYIPNLTTKLVDPEDGTSFTYMAVVQSPFLTQNVNASRTDFNIGQGEDADAPRARFPDDISKEEIRNECLSFVQRDLADILRTMNLEKEQRIRRYIHEEAPQYKVLMRHKDEWIGKVPPAFTRQDLDTILHRELHQKEVRLKQEGSRILKEGDRLDDYEEYRKRLTAFMANYNELGMAALAQHVTHRKIILELLEKAISKDVAKDAYPLERAVHHLIFPMRETSDDLLYDQQNLWIIDERLTYHSFIASDKSLLSIEHLENRSGKRPDLLVFDRRLVIGPGEQPVSSFFLVEFKRPQRDDYTLEKNPLQQAFELVEEIRAGQFKDEKDAQFQQHPPMSQHPTTPSPT